MHFQFKKFTVHQEKSAMKIGTDAVILGAWTPIEHPFSILDIGAGTGIIALILAQRSGAQQIDALEIDDDAYEECVENFENSPWNDSLFCYHAAFDEFIEEMEDEQYDLIVSNPPFYTEDYFSSNEKRDTARFTEALPFTELLEGASLLLSEEGTFSVIIPYKSEEKFIEIAHSHKLFPYKITRVKGTETSEIKRSLIAFTKEKKELKEDELIIEISRHQYTPEYISLTKDFYLKM
jgi:tRNA1Val (adenine37-N6)-methyltransferase